MTRWKESCDDCGRGKDDDDESAARVPDDDDACAALEDDVRQRAYVVEHALADQVMREAEPGHAMGGD